MKTRIAILISGRGSNMEAILHEVRDGVLRDCCEPVIVISNRPDAPGVATAQTMGVPTTVVPSRGLDRDGLSTALVEALEPHRVDYVVLAGFMRILGSAMTRRYPDRIVNIHPADTRCFTGIGGYEWAWRQRLPATMVTVHLVDDDVDTGRILAQAPVSMEGISSLEELEGRGLAVEHRLYSLVLHDLFTTDN